ncbi:tryptophan synthase subunit alpha [Pseudomonas sp. COR18]|uniref:tryptophan synthase subunit alpha n=1 Tax=Pseudomonas sp. COR18 TaxID=3399680 RepID=UPI003AFF97E5
MHRTFPKRQKRDHCQQQSAALVTFVTAGDPGYDTSLAILKGLPKAGADVIELGMPFTDPMADGRLPTVLNGSSGFVYYVSVAGVTGAGSATLEHVEEAVTRLRRHTDLPISIGFDIRTPEQAAAIARLADGVVVGSALIDQIAKAETGEQAVDGVLSLCAALAEGVRGARH